MSTQLKKIIVPVQSISYVFGAIIKYNEQNKLKEAVYLGLQIWNESVMVGKVQHANKIKKLDDHFFIYTQESVKEQELC